MSNKAETVKPENRIVKYLRETRAELRKVTWPTPEEARNLTGIVLVVTVAMALLMWVLDLIFGGVIGLLVG
ncbi:MAG: preprotein translocase subunit SecE [Caldilineales bacterium]|nr:preprotein translocase subunit SecE [Caldilineales bacterium]MDW8319161.1 preprotein translocase subunit SecE [Anaerolineae bacterium]